MLKGIVASASATSLVLGILLRGFLHDVRINSGFERGTRDGDIRSMVGECSSSVTYVLVSPTKDECCLRVNSRDLPFWMHNLKFSFVVGKNFLPLIVVKER